MSYAVQAGDTFWSISKKFNTSVEALEAANPGISAANLQIGQHLKIPQGGTHKYTIVQGDTFYSIAQKFHTSVGAIEQANPGVNPSSLKIGQVINIPGGSDGNTGSSPPPPSSGNGYVNYSGPASNFPDPKTWASWDNLWKENTRLMKYHDSDAEVELIREAIDTVSKQSGVDDRIILCIIVQESGGNPRIPTTNNGVRNPGLMQSHNGVEFNPNDPKGSILQMVRDGTTGTKDGDGLKQCHEKTGNWYAAFRMYNSGSVNPNDLNDPKGATASYVRDAANRLMGHVWNNM